MIDPVRLQESAEAFSLISPKLQSPNFFIVLLCALIIGGIRIYYQEKHK